MSLARTGVIFGEELARTFKRPLFWFLVALLALMSWGLSTGHMQIASGDSSVGGTKAWVTSEFAFARAVMALMALLYGFFTSIAAGMAVVADDEARISDMLLSTPLKPSEYVWGKFLAILAGFLSVLGLHILLTIFFNHGLPNPEALEIRGPLHWGNYLRPALVFGLPTLVFYLGVAFFLGERWRRPVTVFLFPIAVMMACGFFLWSWAPTWLDPRINRLLMLVDPSGFRWINETWIKLDRGASFYNTARVGLDLPLSSRAWPSWPWGSAGSGSRSGTWPPISRGRPEADGGRGGGEPSPSLWRRGWRRSRPWRSCGCARGRSGSAPAPWRWPARSCATCSPRPASTCSAPSSCWRPWATA